MNTNNTVKLEERFYVGERGFKFVVKTGLEMSVVAEGEIKSVLKCPHGIVIKRNIPITDIQDIPSGTVLMPIEDGDLSEPGTYLGQIFIFDSSMGRARPSHVFSFEVSKPTVGDFEAMFP